MTQKSKYKIIDYTKIDGVPCPCGIARRRLYDVEDFPGTIHRTDIDRKAKPHFHEKTTEVYYIVSCEPGAVMHLDDDRIKLHEEMAFYIPPGTTHCLDGKAKVFIVALPKFDPADEFVVENESSATV
jgi:mannose-6-phosphate isomerase-like protein (cupin superfamily)